MNKNDIDWEFLIFIGLVFGSFMVLIICATIAGIYGVK